MTFLFNKWNINTGLFQLNLSPQVVHVSQFRIILQDLDHSDPWPPLALIITSLLYMFDTLVLKEKKLHHGIHLSTCAERETRYIQYRPIHLFQVLYLVLIVKHYQTMKKNVEDKKSLKTTQWSKEKGQTTIYKTLHIKLRRIWRYQRRNQNPYIEEEQWPKRKRTKGQKDKQRSTKHTYKTKDQVTWTPLITG